jgi:cyanate permease
LVFSSFRQFRLGEACPGRPGLVNARKRAALTGLVSCAIPNCRQTVHNLDIGVEARPNELHTGRTRCSVFGLFASRSPAAARTGIELFRPIAWWRRVLLQKSPPGPAVVRDRANWGMLALGWTIYFSFGMVMASLVPIVSIVKAELGLSYTQLGIIFGAWQLVFMGAAAPAGWLIDRFGPKRVLTVGALIMAISAIMRSFADGFPLLLAAVAFFGFGGPITAIGLTKLVADWFTGASRGIASGIYITGAAAGSAVVLALTHPVILPLTGGWRQAHYLYGAIAFAIALAWFLFGRDSPQSTSDRKATRQAKAKGSYRQVVTQPAVWLVIIVGFAGFLANHGVRNWLPEILSNAGISPTRAGLLAALPAVTGIVGSIMVLHFATRRAGGRKIAVTGLLIVTGLAVLTIMVAKGWLLVLAIAVEGFCAGAFAPLMLNTLMEMPSVGARNTGAAAGLYFSIGELGGTTGPLLMGVAADITGSFMAGMVLVASIMFAMVLPASRIRI